MKSSNPLALVIGVGGFIASLVSKQILRNPKTAIALDINENSLVELVRDLRSLTGYIEGDFKTV